MTIVTVSLYKLLFLYYFKFCFLVHFVFLRFDRDVTLRDCLVTAASALSSVSRCAGNYRASCERDAHISRRERIIIACVRISREQEAETRWPRAKSWYVCRFEMDFAAKNDRLFQRERGRDTQTNAQLNCRRFSPKPFSSQQIPSRAFRNYTEIKQDAVCENQS